MQFRKIIFSLTGLVFANIFFCSNAFYSSDVKGFKVLNMNNDTVNLELESKATIICYYSIFCNPCIKELNVLEANIGKWKEEFDVQIIAIASKYDENYKDKIISFSKRKNFSYPLYIDINNEVTDFLYSQQNIKKENNFRIFNNNLEVLKPQLFIVDYNGNVLYQKRGFMDGDESKIYEFLKDYSNQ